MNYRDRIYGQTEIKEPVILDLINSPVLQRLKEIDQAGYFEPYHPGSKHSRFEHSVGVYLLLRKFGASLKEQIAGLIHDVSHSAFSHAIDYALSEGSEKEQSHQDNYFEEYVLNSTIPRILDKYEINVDHILDKNNFPLLETQLPDLCADRIDYSLRGLLVYGIVQEDKIKDILSNLIIENKAWVFRDLDSAYEYAKLFKDLNEDYYLGLETAVMFRRVGDYLKYALGKNYACREDLYTTDKEVIDKINQNLESDGKLKNLWDRMNNSRGYENNTDDYDAKVYCKSRVIDPFCRHKGEIKRVSAVKLNWKGIVEKESRPKVYFLKFNDVK